MDKNWFFVGLVLIALAFSNIGLAQEPQFEKYETPRNPKYPWPVSDKQFDAEPFAVGDISRFMFDNWSGPAIPVWAYVPTDVDVREAPILFMLHGAKRNPVRYLLEWAPHAQEKGFIVIAPEFGRRDFRGSRRYNRGNVFTKEDGAYLPVEESQWAFSAIEPLFDHVLAALNSQQSAYTIFGHSAGAQFVHRFVYYKPNARVRLYMAANSGWYTLPDMAVAYPYGLKDSGVSSDTWRATLSKPVLVLLGDQDVVENSKSLNKSDGAMQQGTHRYNRGVTFMLTAKEQTEALGMDMAWRVMRVRGVGHSNSGIAKAAASFVQ